MWRVQLESSFDSAAKFGEDRWQRLERKRKVRNRKEGTLVPTNELDVEPHKRFCNALILELLIVRETRRGHHVADAEPCRDLGHDNFGPATKNDERRAAPLPFLAERVDGFEQKSKAPHANPRDAGNGGLGRSFGHAHDTANAVRSDGERALERRVVVEPQVGPMPDERASIHGFAWTCSDASRGTNASMRRCRRAAGDGVLTLNGLFSGKHTPSKSPSTTRHRDGGAGQL